MPCEIGLWLMIATTHLKLYLHPSAQYGFYITDKEADRQHTSLLLVGVVRETVASTISEYWKDRKFNG